MNTIDNNIFVSYETVETALLNELATEVKTRGKKARTVKGEGYYVKYDGVKYDVTPEQCRIYRLIRNNYNMFAEQLNSVKSDILGFWKVAFGERLPTIIANLEKGLEICQEYFDAFKSFVTEPVKNVAETVEEVETISEVEAASVVAPETSEKNETETSEEVIDETSESETSKSEDVDVDFLIREMRCNNVIFEDDKIIVNEDETGVDIDVYRNGRWCTNIVLYEYD